MVDSVLSIFRRIYTLRRRRRRADFVGSGVRERAALAFSVCNALTRAGVPRPPEDVAAAMALESLRPMLDMARCLGFTEEEQSELSTWQECTELLDPDPADYTDVVCAKLDISFNIAGEIREEVPCILAQLYGRHPLVVLAVTVKCVLEARAGGQALGREQERRLCEVARCQPRTLKAAAEELRRKLLKHPAASSREHLTTFAPPQQHDGGLHQHGSPGGAPTEQWHGRWARLKPSKALHHYRLLGGESLASGGESGQNGGEGCKETRQQVQEETRLQREETRRVQTSEDHEHGLSARRAEQQTCADARADGAGRGAAEDLGHTGMGQGTSPTGSRAHHVQAAEGVH